MNQISIFGRLTRDPELKYTQAGKPVTNFTIAVNRYGDNNEADFFECNAWDKQAENINNSCKKGHRILIWGYLRQEKWTDQQTQQQRSAVKVVVTGFNFIEPAPTAGNTPQPQPNQQQQAWGQPTGYPPGYVPAPAANLQTPGYMQTPPQNNQNQQPINQGSPSPGGYYSSNLNDLPF